MILLLLACASEPTPAPPLGPLAVVTTSFPVDWLVRRIGGDDIVARCILPAGEDPPFWQPSGEVVASLVDADLVLANGAGYEAWMGTASLPTSRLVVTTNGVDVIEVEGTTHSHGKAGSHSHAGTDPHTWSDPLTFLQQAHAVRDAFVAADPAHADGHTTRAAALETELRALDGEYRAALAGVAPLAASHPAYNYLARRYGLELTTFAFDPDVPPSAEQLSRFIAWVDGNPTPYLLWEVQPSDQVTAAFPPNISHVTLDPLEQPEDGIYDYTARSRTNIGIASLLPRTK